jgi:hypothetical protein
VLINCRAYDNLGGGIKVWRRAEDNYSEKTVSVINSLVYNNGYYAPNPNEGNPGIKVSAGAGLNVYNSVIDNNYDEGIKINYDATKHQLPINVYNSIISNTIAGPGFFSGYFGAVSDYNLYYNNSGGNVEGITLGNNSITGQNPLFNLDHSVKNESPAIDSGLDLSSVFNHDINNDLRASGSGWDIGAYEYLKKRYVSRVGNAGRGFLLFRYSEQGLY